MSRLLIIEHTNKLFNVSDSVPIKLRLVETSNPDDKTKTYSIILDYDWCERILCNSVYFKDAIDLLTIIGNYLNIPIER